MVTEKINISEIKELIPHREPFLYIDELVNIIKLKKATGVKTFNKNDDFFKGHFPDYPVMPGVIIIEAMAQMGGILVMSKLEDPQNYLTFFAKIDKVRFRNKVLPNGTFGDLVKKEVTIEVFKDE